MEVGMDKELVKILTETTYRASDAADELRFRANELEAEARCVAERAKLLRDNINRMKALIDAK